MILFYDFFFLTVNCVHCFCAADMPRYAMSVLVLNEVDKLSREAQHSLRRTMEKYSASCRLILCCNSSSKVTEAVRSRCLNVRISAPTEPQVSNAVSFSFKKKFLSFMEDR